MTAPLAYKAGDPVTIIKSGAHGLVTKIWDRPGRPLIEIEYIGAHLQKTWCYFFADELMPRVVEEKKPDA
jgi:hypothetical protein